MKQKALDWTCAFTAAKTMVAKKMETTIAVTNLHNKRKLEVKHDRRKTNKTV